MLICAKKFLTEKKKKKTADFVNRFQWHLAKVLNEQLIAIINLILSFFASCQCTFYSFNLKPLSFSFFFFLALGAQF